MRSWMSVLVVMAACAGSWGQAAPGGRTPVSALTLERVMGDPEWIARSPERVWWSDDGAALFYTRKREGSEVRDTWRVDVSTEDGVIRASGERVLGDAEELLADQRAGDWSADRTRKVFSRQGDVILKDMTTGEERALTRTSASEFGARFMADEGRIMFQRDGAVLSRHLASGLEEQLVDLRFVDEPKEREEKPDYLREQQERLFETVRQSRARREVQRKEEEAERKAREALGPVLVYMGSELESRGVEVSPDGSWAIVRATKKGPARESKRDVMPAWVTEDGYARSSPVRAKVGTSERRAEELYLIDLRAGAAERKFRLDLGVLPGISEDPLAEIKEAAAARKKAAAGEGTKDGDAGAGPERKKEEARARGAYVREVSWSDDGARVVVQVFSIDNKDRWIAAVDLEKRALAPLEREHNAAWVNGRFAELGWLKDNRTIWYLAETTGYSHVYAMDVADVLGGGAPAARRVTGWEGEGRYEVSDVRESFDGAWLYFTANMERPGVYELYRVPTGGVEAKAEAMTALGGLNDFVISPDERSVAVLHSDVVTPNEVYVQSLTGGGAGAVRVTRTVTEEYEAIEWIKPEVVGVPGRDGRVIWARVYEKSGNTRATKPCVVFVHGAGYLQDADEGWSNYFREHMFHNLLCERGYVVIAPDFRASSGYGRDWRTAIYRRMGEPELEDLEDCIAWLAEERGVDRGRVGIYGGSYGGFLALMAMFTRPGEYACGAALRPVTDWAHYNDGYTANILNTPEVDPEAYERSSPIEHAAGLRGPLLICHGMLDDNVLFMDTVRLAQRLIELKKERWEVAMYPVEAHAFREPASWLDEYRRIDSLFWRHLEGPGSPEVGEGSERREGEDAGG